MEKHDTPEWGLRCDVMPRFSARLVQEGNGITGAFNEEECHQLNAAFSHFVNRWS